MASATEDGAIDVDMLRPRFIEYAVQYYTTGRCAVATGLNPVAANIIHHAVEMFLKAGLCGHTTEKERKCELKHDLPKIWQVFKNHYDPEGRFARFDECVAALHRYEDIRYPEGVMKLSVVAMRMQAAKVDQPKAHLAGVTKGRRRFNPAVPEMNR